MTRVLDDWARLHLLRHPGHTQETSSGRQRTRKIFDDIAALSLVRSTRTLWRGLARVSYRLSPSLVHSPGSSVRITSGRAAVEHATNLVAEVRVARHVWREGVGLRALTPLEDLALLQHFGTPTPLLDLTADPLVALYFAVRRHDDEDGLLVGWNAVDWPDLTAEREPYEDIVDRLSQDRTLGWFIPPVVTDRVVVQRSRMLVAPVLPSARRAWFAPISDLALPDLPPGWGGEQLQALFAVRGQGRRAMPPVIAFRVNRGLKAYIREILMDSYGISHTTMFPDPSGYATERPPQA